MSFSVHLSIFTSELFVFVGLKTHDINLHVALFLHKQYFFCSYDSGSGTFTVPPGGDGFYYFSVYVMVNAGEECRFNLEINGEKLCSLDGDQNKSTGDESQSACSAAAYAAEGLYKFLDKII